MPSIQSGNKFWPSLEALISDACRSSFLKEENRGLRNLIGALASKGKIRIPMKDVDAHLPYQTAFDPVSNEYIVIGDK